jgi:hypothetical protein
MTPEEKLQQDRDLSWYFLADGNDRQLRGLLLDQKVETLQEWMKLARRYEHELGRALAWNYSGALEGEDNPQDQSGQATGDQGGQGS